MKDEMKYQMQTKDNQRSLNINFEGICAATDTINPYLL